jgi:hypothetical protein
MEMRLRTSGTLHLYPLYAFLHHNVCAAELPSGQCYLNAATTERITLVSNGAVVYTFHYQVEPSPSDGICSERDTSTALNTTLSIVGLRAPPRYNCVSIQNTTVQSLMTLCSPELRTPPPLTPQGQPVVPIPEKTFIQKYWMYIVLFLGIMCEPPSFFVTNVWLIFYGHP